MVRDHRLDGELCVAVWVGRAKRALFGDGDHALEAGRVAVDGRGGGEDDVGDVVLLHRSQEAEGAEDVDAVVLERDLAGFTNSLPFGQHCFLSAHPIGSAYLQRSEVNDIVDVGMLVEDGIQLLLIRDVALGVLRLLPTDQLDPVEDLGVGVVGVVDDDDLVVGLEQGEGGERANVAGATTTMVSRLLFALVSVNV